MLTKNIKYPYTKLGFDMLGIIAFIGVVTIVALNCYLHTESGGNFEMGFSVSGMSSTIMSVLFLITLISALVSYLLKKIK